MKTHWFYILLSVSSCPRYGTTIQDDVRALSDGRERLWPATLYGSLEELVALQWLEELRGDERPGEVSGRERYYQMTSVGRAALESEVKRLESLARLSRERLNAGRSGP